MLGLTLAKRLKALDLFGRDLLPVAVVDRSPEGTEHQLGHLAMAQLEFEPDPVEVLAF